MPKIRACGTHYSSIRPLGFAELCGYCVRPQFTFKFKSLSISALTAFFAVFFTTITSPENQSLKHKFAHCFREFAHSSGKFAHKNQNLHTKMQVCTLIFKTCLCKKTSGKRLSLAEVFFLYANLFVRLFYAIFLSLELTTRTLCCFMYSVHFM